MEPFEVENANQQRSLIDRKLVMMGACNFFFNLGISYILPFYPDLASGQAGLDYSVIGMVMCLNSIGLISFSFIFGTMIQIWGRKQSLMLALFFQGFVMFGFGFVYYITDHPILFLTISIVARILQGVARAIFQIVNFAYISIFWHSSFVKKLGFMETMACVGLMLGPFIGAFLNYCFGYAIPLFIFSFTIIMCAVGINFTIPHDKFLQYNPTQKSKLPLCQSLKHKEIILTIIVLVVNRGAMNYFTSFFTHHVESFHFNSEIASLAISVPQIAYFISIQLVPIIFNPEDNHFLIQCGLMICIVGNFIAAPIVMFDDTITHLIFGLVIIGSAQSLSRLLAIPHLVDRLKVLSSDRLQSSLTDMASALFQLSSGISDFTFPLLGGIVYDLFGGQTEVILEEKKAFQNSVRFLTLLQIICLVMFLFYGKGYLAIKDKFTKKKGNEGISKQLVDEKREQSSSSSAEGTQFEEEL